MPVTSPEELIVAISGLLLLHVPPGTDAEKEVVAPEQTNGVPEIVIDEYTVIDFVAKRVPTA